MLVNIAAVTSIAGPARAITARVTRVAVADTRRRVTDATVAAFGILLRASDGPPMSICVDTDSVHTSEYWIDGWEIAELGTESDEDSVCTFRVAYRIDAYTRYLGARLVHRIIRGAWQERIIRQIDRTIESVPLIIVVEAQEGEGGGVAVYGGGVLPIPCAEAVPFPLLFRKAFYVEFMVLHKPIPRSPIRAYIGIRYWQPARGGVESHDPPRTALTRCLARVEQRLGLGGYRIFHIHSPDGRERLQSSFQVGCARLETQRPCLMLPEPERQLPCSRGAYDLLRLERAFI